MICDRLKIARLSDDFCPADWSRPRSKAKARKAAIWLHFHRSRHGQLVPCSKPNVHMVTRLNHAQLDSLAMQNNRAIRWNVKELKTVLHQDRQFPLHGVHALNNSFCGLRLARGSEASGRFEMF